ncbi:hypothetical protein BEWA_040370 [Theileria equi strain WA]|uniref:Signal peptide-containing protein n=1 Tax=Theileria equi strain WA TaxID=1537102 RepID=L1LFE8_THEEQ|nr:hypothetical protein BEWA_040370 [Theileria equi strain WA]EKX73999.1 hypothetical protein BEWA_040370 [Theileria equi strain WA]|eukprot:XP_004833451.1 hypothetical protein BEWA_040370 [Theileria equi strain WA]
MIIICVILMTLFSQVVKSYAIIDISKNDDVAHTRQYGSSDLYQTVYINKMGEPVGYIVDGDTLVWSHDKNTFCRQFSLYKINGVKKIASLFIDKKLERIYFLYFSGVYARIGVSDYANIFDRLVKGRVFDISAPVDHNTFMVQKYRPFGSSSRIYVPRKDLDVVKIMQGDQTIWKPRNCEKVESFVIHGVPGKENLLSVLIKEGRESEVYYFAKEESQWRKVSNVVFYAKLSIFDIEAENENFDSEISRLRAELESYNSMEVDQENNPYSVRV